MSDSPKLQLHDVHAGYDESLILRDLVMTIPENSVVTLLGRNGVGK